MCDSLVVHTASKYANIPQLPHPNEVMFNMVNIWKKLEG